MFYSVATEGLVTTWTYVILVATILTYALFWSCLYIWLLDIYGLTASLDAVF